MLRRRDSTELNFVSTLHIVISYCMVAADLVMGKRAFPLTCLDESGRDEEEKSPPLSKTEPNGHQSSQFFVWASSPDRLDPPNDGAPCCMQSGSCTEAYPAPD